MFDLGSANNTVYEAGGIKEARKEENRIKSSTLARPIWIISTYPPTQSSLNLTSPLLILQQSSPVLLSFSQTRHDASISLVIRTQLGNSLRGCLLWTLNGILLRHALSPSKSFSERNRAQEYRYISNAVNQLVFQEQSRIVHTTAGGIYPPRSVLHGPIPLAQSLLYGLLHNRGVLNGTDSLLGELSSIWGQCGEGIPRFGWRFAHGFINLKPGVLLSFRT